MTIPLEQFGECTLDDDGCGVCGDTAVPVRVLAVTGTDAEVEDRLGNRARVAIELVPGTAADDVLLVHLGVAIRRLPEVRPATARGVGVRPESR